MRHPQRQGVLTVEQYQTLRRPINRNRIAKRSHGGKDLSYLEAWDVKAHLTRIFGFANYDSEVIETEPVFERPVKVGAGEREKDGIECAWMVTVRLTIRDAKGRRLCRFTESAVGSAVGTVNYGDLHDNAVKQAASDALKRCAINLGNQFGLSLYDNGSTADVVRKPLIAPKGGEVPPKAADEAESDEQAKVLKDSLGATDKPSEGAQGTPEPDGPQFSNTADTADEAAAKVRQMQTRTSVS